METSSTKLSWIGVNYTFACTLAVDFCHLRLHVVRHRRWSEVRAQLTTG